MNAEQDVACNPRNPLGGVLKSNAGIEFFKNFSKYIEIDVKGRDVTIYNFLSVLTGRQTHLSNRLLSGPDSNVFLYMTGHGGDEFFKFQDAEELSAQEFAFAVGEMYDKAMYKEMLIVLDTCQASTMCKYIDVPHVFCIASSQKGENSYAYIPDSDIGIPVMDRFTYAFTDFLMKNYRLKSSLTFHSKSADISLQNFIESLDPYFLKSNPSISSSPESRSCSLSKLQDFIFNSHDFSFSQMTQSYFSSYTSSKSKESHVVELQQDL
jgi:phosphatidylinositol glycan class K